MLSEEYGLHRVVHQEGVLPQQAERLDPSLPLRETELLIDVDSLNIDAASWAQIWRQASADVREVSKIIAAIVRARGKMHNPATGSGGMLIGRVSQIGARHPASSRLRPGDRIATLVSLTLTPLFLEEIKAIDPLTERVDVRGYAILFASGQYAKLSGDLPDPVALAVLDVCGAPAQVARLAKPGMRVMVLGAGKSGTLSLAQARKSLSGKGQIIALDISARALQTLRELDFCDVAIEADATRAMEVMQRVSDATGGALCDLVVNCASAANTEMSTVLSTAKSGVALFFSMTTRFTAATLGAEGVAKDVTLLMGNGYLPGHAELALDLLRTDDRLRRLFEARYAALAPAAPSASNSGAP
ncbi:MAG TPA: L-erythro-3,5-diaminohexanoate dehydrogenase [Myxococcaceae bacterium]|nr:L-erythro-3,5-diaminohexanoate dehydrogenase [Myxococcaceae bacterium]